MEEKETMYVVSKGWEWLCELCGKWNDFSDDAMPIVEDELYECAHCGAEVYLEKSR